MGQQAPGCSRSQDVENCVDQLPRPPSAGARRAAPPGSAARSGPIARRSGQGRRRAAWATCAWASMSAAVVNPTPHASRPSRLGNPLLRRLLRYRGLPHAQRVRPRRRKVDDAGTGRPGGPPQRFTELHRAAPGMPDISTPPPMKRRCLSMAGAYGGRCGDRARLAVSSAKEESRRGERCGGFCDPGQSRHHRREQRHRANVRL